VQATPTQRSKEYPDISEKILEKLKG